MFSKLNCHETIRWEAGGRVPQLSPSTSIPNSSHSLLSLFAIMYFDFWWELDKQMFTFYRDSSLRQSRVVCVWIFYLISWFEMVQAEFITCSTFSSQLGQEHRNFFSHPFYYLAIESWMESNSGYFLENLQGSFTHYEKPQGRFLHYIQP